MRDRKSLLALVLAVCSLVAAAGAGAGTERSDATFRVGVVTDIGGLNDRGFNQLAYQGMKRAERQLGVEGRVVISKSNADYIPNLAKLARDKYDLVIAVGFLMSDAVDVTARRFPDTKFAIVDVDQSTLKHKPKNVRGLLWREQEHGYAVGYLAGLVVKQQGGDQVVSTVGGIKIPPVDRFIAGYQAGAKAANPGIKTLNDYSQDFVDQAKCKEIALKQIGAGSQAVFAVAGLCGLGALDAAKEKGVWGIGGDADLAYLGPHILVSELKKVDVSVFLTTKEAKAGTFKGGANGYFTFANGGAGIGKISPKVPKTIVAKLRTVVKKLAAGQIKNIPTTVK